MDEYDNTINEYKNTRNGKHNMKGEFLGPGLQHSVMEEYNVIWTRTRTLRMMLRNMRTGAICRP
jgi:hypothetical protein